MDIKKKNNGFTLVEMMVVLAMITILTAFAYPAVSRWLPQYRLKAAANELLANLQRARMEAIRENRTVQVVFNNLVNPGFYFFDLNNNNIQDADEFRVDLSDYKSGVDFGAGNAALNWGGNAINQANVIRFFARGTSWASSVYLQNAEATTCYAITTSIAGYTKMRFYTGIVPFNVNNWEQ